MLVGEVDYLLADDLLLHDLFERYGERADRMLEVGRQSLVRRSLHFGVRRDLAKAQERVAAFDAAIQTMIVDGTYNRILGVT